MSHDLELAKLRDALNSHPGLVLELTPLQALTVLGHIQLALHPHRGPSSAIARAVADSLIKGLAALNSHTGLLLELTPLQALTVLGHIQRALRHPHRGPSSAIARAVADRLIRGLAVGDAEIEEVLRRGD